MEVTMNKPKQSKSSFNWYKSRQRFSIRKYHFGAASVLLGAALVLGGGQVAADEPSASNDIKVVVTQTADEDAPTKAQEGTKESITTPSVEESKTEASSDVTEESTAPSVEESKEAETAPSGEENKTENQESTA